VRALCFADPFRTDQKNSAGSPEFNRGTSVHLSTETNTLPANCLFGSDRTGMACGQDNGQLGRDTKALSFRGGGWNVFVRLTNRLAQERESTGGNPFGSKNR
jgi:hypothetical protein